MVSENMEEAFVYAVVFLHLTATVMQPPNFAFAFAPFSYKTLLNKINLYKSEGCPMNGTIKGASQQTMHNERDDGNTTIIHTTSKEAEEKEGIKFDKRNPAHLCMKKEKNLSLHAFLNQVAKK